MKIVLSQINFTIGDIESNKEKIVEQVALAAAYGAELVVFSEMSLSGTPTYDIVNMKDYVDRCYMALSDIASANEDIAILVGVPSVVEEDRFSSAVLLKGGEIEAIFNKSMIFSRDELPYFSGIDSPFFSDEDSDNQTISENIIDIDGVKLLVTLGDDIDFVEYMECFEAKGSRPDAIINMTAIPFAIGAIAENNQRYSSIAQNVDTPIVVVNAVGGNADIIYYGGSAAYNADGKMCASLSLFESQSKVVNLSSQMGEQKAEILSEIEQLYRAVSLGLRDYFEKTGFKSACLGLSGGIDSAVVAAIATEVLGAENIRVALMPSQFSSDHSISDALKLAENLGIKHETIAIEPIYNSFMMALEGSFKGTAFSLAEENLQARIRGTIMMAISNKFGNLLLNTSNKSEAAMGYGTLYGDTNGSLGILGDLYKTQVYDLARYINRDTEIIPINTINKAPSAELRPGQKDSDSLPEYDMLDQILYLMIEEGESAAEIIGKGLDRKAVNKVAKALGSTEFKRYQLPPVLRISKCPLGKGRVIPLVSKYTI